METMLKMVVGLSSSSPVSSTLLGDVCTYEKWAECKSSREAPQSLRRGRRRSDFGCRCLFVEEGCTIQEVGLTLGRRNASLVGLAGCAASSFGWLFAEPAAAKDVAVGVYLPPSQSVAGFVQFTASSKDTPALRAGNVQPYKFVLPPSWKQARVANILSGNYCQPKCAEPWVEVKFEDGKQGTAQVFASPMVRLTNKPYAKIEEIGTPEKLISALGPFVTGNSYDPDEVVETHVEKRGDETYYVYTLDTPLARTGTHNLAAATAKGNVVLLFVVSANDTQWASSEGVLKTVLESFQA
ncbi:hypothetical protein GOP47_0022518 [Adiantum capillus-veneris]|uniref:PsbP C-terminal domain-containing protein n=1 Tax=Adiantum capillus-veneris TaxID=13818 RepID=A0A9D4U7J1_ADICA|nr:hypothetical protein GOP47_0022518 [Adiantum capillus-veneris]